MRLEGTHLRYVGDNWRHSPSSQWEGVLIAMRDHVNVRRAGTRKIHGIRLTVYACNECPHTFYAG